MKDEDEKIVQIVPAPPGWYLYVNTSEGWSADTVGCFALTVRTTPRGETDRNVIPLVVYSTDMLCLDEHEASPGETETLLIQPSQRPPEWATPERRLPWVSVAVPAYWDLGGTAVS